MKELAQDLEGGQGERLLFGEVVGILHGSELVTQCFLSRHCGRCVGSSDFFQPPYQHFSGQINWIFKLILYFLFFFFGCRGDQMKWFIKPLAPSSTFQPLS